MQNSRTSARARWWAGRAADLAVLSQDIFHIAPGDIPATTSELTMVGGRVVWDSGVLHPAP